MSPNAFGREEGVMNNREVWENRALLCLGLLPMAYVIAVVVLALLGRP